MPATTAAVNSRLSARWHVRQIETVLRADRIAAEIDPITSRLQSRLYELTAGLDLTNAGKLAGAIEFAVRAALVEITRTLDDRLAAMCSWSFADASQRLIGVIPRQWWRGLYPFLPESRQVWERHDDLEDFLAQPEPVVVGAVGVRQAATAIGAAAGAVDVQFSPGPAVVAAAKRAATGAEPAATTTAGTQALRRALAQSVFKPPTQAEVRAIVMAPARDGTTWVQRLQSLSAKVKRPQALANELITGISRGEGIRELRNRVDELVGPLHGSSLRIARTEAVRVAEYGQRKSWEGLGDMHAGVQIVAVLDERTRPEHAARHGTVYLKSGNPPIEAAPDPPDAPNCRCTLATVLRPPKAVGPSFAPASDKIIPDPASYDQWFSAADERRRKLAVGAGRYRVIADKLGPGTKPQWADFLGRDGKLMSAGELAAEAAETRLNRIADVSAQIAKRAADYREILRFGFLRGS